MNKLCLTDSPKIRILIFLGSLGYLTGAACYFAIDRPSPWISLLVMWSPGFAALLTGLVIRRPFSEIGLRPGKPKYLLAGWLLPIVAASLVYGVAWASGIGGVPSPTFLKRAALTLHLGGGLPALEIVLRAFAYISTMGLLNIGALGEELGWRGFLVPELNRWIGFRRAALFSGIIWALWHWPMMIWGAYLGGTPLPYALVCLTIMTISTGIWQAWLRMKSGSIWPCFIMHAAHNAIVQTFFDRVTVDTGYTTYFTTEFGAGLAAVSLLMAIWFWRRSPEYIVRPGKLPDAAALTPNPALG